MSPSRRRKNEQPGPSGFLVVDKPIGCTSHDVVNAARRWFGTRRVGHLGTLDPLATGVLPLAIRDATKLIPFLPRGQRVYVGAFRLGEATDTQDAEGKITERHEGPLPSEATVRDALRGFVGDIEQIPPMYSSVKHAGEPLHRIARRGESVERAPRKIRIERFELTEWKPPEMGVEVVCSPGTYVRTLAHDLGRQLGCGAHLARLRREESGPFRLAHAHTMDEMDGAAEGGEADAMLVPPAEVLGMPVVRIGEPDLRRIAHGGEVPAPPAAQSPPIGSKVAATDGDGTLVAICELRPDRRLYPVRVLRAANPQ